MILYLGSGPRRYGEKPIPVHRREGWEFQLILRGSCSLIRTGGGRQAAEEGTLWVFAPSEAHGWGGERGEECEVRVAHFSRVPDLLTAYLAGKGFASVRLNFDSLDFLMKCFDPLFDSMKNSSPLGGLYSERLLQELAILLLGEASSASLGLSPPASARLVSSALSYFREHMHEGATVEEAAAAVFRSAGHLRRLFHEVLGAPPRAVFMKERMKRAEELLQAGDEKFEVLAEACGFDSAGSFVRAFKAAKGVTPSRWRKTKTTRSAGAEGRPGVSYRRRH